MLYAKLEAILKLCPVRPDKTEFSIWAISASHLILTAPIMDCGTGPPPPPPVAAGCDVRMVQQISQAPCIANETFGCYGTANASDASVWLTGGCRAELLCDGIVPSDPGCMANQSHGPLGSRKRFICPCVTPPPDPQDKPKRCKPGLNAVQKEILFNHEM